MEPNGETSSAFSSCYQVKLIALTADVTSQAFKSTQVSLIWYCIL